MKSREVFAFIQGMFEDGTLPGGRNLWGYAYNIDRYPAALRAAALHGMSEYAFQQWMLEYARRSKKEKPLMLPVVVRWGENERPERALVHVPLYTMKDFDSLPSATEAALKLEVNTDAGEEVYMRDMRAPDVPDVWARIVIDSKEKEVQFNPLKMWRGEVKLIRGGCDLKQVHVLEWHVVGSESASVDTTPEQPLHDNEQQKTAKTTAQTDPPPELPKFQTKQKQKPASWVDSLPKWLQRCLIALGALFWIIVPIKGCMWLMEPPPPALPKVGERVKITAKKCTAWSNPDAFRRCDLHRSKSRWKEARQVMREQKEMMQIKQIPHGACGKVIDTGAKCADEKNGRYTWVLFDKHGGWWIRSSDAARID